VIVGLGIDLMESSRFATELQRGAWQGADGVFAPSEIKYCNAGQHPERRYAACFATKEATLKALGAELADTGMLREVEVRLNHEHHDAIVLRGRLQAIATGLGVEQIHFSLAMQKTNVAAMVILEC